MADVVYPAMLPDFLIDSYGYDDDDDLVRTDMEGGPSRVRRRTRQNGTVFNVSSSMTYTQFKIFEAWYRYKLGNGVEWFDVDLAVGSGMVTHTARFKGKWSVRLSGPKRWTVSAKLEVEERQTMTEAELDAALTPPPAGGIIGQWNLNDNAADTVVTAAVGPHAVMSGGFTQAFHTSDCMEGNGAFNMGSLEGHVSVTSQAMCSAIDSGTFSFQFGIKFEDLVPMYNPVFIGSDTLVIELGTSTTFLIHYRESVYEIGASTIVNNTWHQYRFVFETMASTTTIKLYAKTYGEDFYMTGQLEITDGAINVITDPEITFFVNFGVSGTTRIADQIIFWNTAASPI